MSWPTINRNEPVLAPTASPVLSDAVRAKIQSFFPRYETKRAVLLPALHIAQHAVGHISWQVMAEIAEMLEIPPSDVMDTVSFYTHFWTHPKGKKVITVCRSVTCEIMGGTAVLEAIKRKLGVGEHETTPDGAYSLVTEECLAGCDHAPCLLINEKLHRMVRPDQVEALLDRSDNDHLSIPRSDLFDAPPESDASDFGSGKGLPSSAGAGQADLDDDLLGRTSDVDEMHASG